MNPDKQPVEGEESSRSGISTFDKNNNNGLLYAPTCTTYFNKNKYLSMSKKKCAHQWNNECLYSTGEYVLFPSRMFHHGYYNDKSNTSFIQAQLFCPNRVHQCPTSPTIHYERQRQRCYPRTFGQIHLIRNER